MGITRKFFAPPKEKKAGSAQTGGPAFSLCPKAQICCRCKGKRRAGKGRIF
jgi:hypothetical protein